MKQLIHTTFVIQMHKKLRTADVYMQTIYFPLTHILIITWSTMITHPVQDLWCTRDQEVQAKTILCEDLWWADVPGSHEEVVGTR